MFIFYKRDARDGTRRVPTTMQEVNLYFISVMQETALGECLLLCMKLMFIFAKRDVRDGTRRVPTTMHEVNLYF